jgi:hypothetical protein
MRLTLRTLLAYLDDILDPSDREELTKKIESSEFANDLIHRTRDTMRRLRLSAPQPLGTGIALDPNTVAEYLDNVLPPDAVGDFERICLESDVHLAEVASCHHVLTMVLGEPAAIDSDTRQRMYAIATAIQQRKRLRVEPAHIPTGAVRPAAVADGGAAALPATASSVNESAVIEIPDYLRTSLWARYRGALVAAAAALLLVATIYFGLGLTGWLGAGRQATDVASMSAAITAPAAEETSPAERTEALGSPASPSMDSTEPMATTDQAAGPSAAPLEQTPPPPFTPGMELPAAASSQPPVESDENSPLAEPAASVASASPYRVPPETPDRYGESSSNDTSTADSASVGAAPPPLRLPAAPIATTEPAKTQGTQSEAPDLGVRIARASSSAIESTQPANDSTAATAATKEPAEVDTTLGTYLGGKTVLLRFDDKSGAWFRLKPRSTVSVGDKLLALPLYRPRITLASGVDLEMVGGTLVKLSSAAASPGTDRSTAASRPRIEVVYGRIVLVNVATTTDRNQLQVAFGTTVGDVSLAPNATLAVEVERKYVPGKDPRQSPSPVAASLFAPNGNIVWSDDKGVRKIDEPARWTVLDGVASDIAADQTSPAWIDSDPVELLSEQRHGAPVVEQALVPERPIDNQLLELYQGSGRREVKSLVARCSVHVGLFVPFIEALRDSDQKSVWNIHIETLRSAMALSPESAEKIWQTLVDQRGEKAATDLFEMLCGYDEDQVGHTPAEMESGAIAHLIDRLEDDNLDYRVLAVYNLRELTGKSLMPNPAGSPNEREQGIRHWRSRLKSGELRPQQ